MKQSKKLKKKCSIEKCNRSPVAKGYCQGHYQRKFKYGKTGAELNAPIAEYGKRFCTAPKCHKPHEAKGYCKAHYSRMLKGQSLDTPVREFGRLGCKVITCNKQHDSKGFCAGHRLRYSKIIKKKELIDLLGGACTDCGEKYPFYVFDFDHVRGTKKASISRLLCSSPNMIDKEVKKCELVCANCHRVRTYSRYEAMDFEELS